MDDLRRKRLEIYIKYGTAVLIEMMKREAQRVAEAHEQNKTDMQSHSSRDGDSGVTRSHTGALAGTDGKAVGGYYLKKNTSFGAEMKDSDADDENDGG